MKINFFPNFNTPNRPFSTNFGTTKLFDVNLRVKNQNDTFELSNAKFSRLEVDDKAQLDEMLSKWSEISPDSYAPYIPIVVGQALPAGLMYVLELGKDGLSLDENVTAIMTTDIFQANRYEGRHLNIEVLQSSPDIECYNQRTKNSPIKGSGETMLYGAVKIAKEQGLDSVMLYSSNDSFYDHIGIKKKFPNATNGDRNIYHIPASEYENFMSKVEKKYNIPTCGVEN